MYFLYSVRGGTDKLFRDVISINVSLLAVAPQATLGVDSVLYFLSFIETFQVARVDLLLAYVWIGAGPWVSGRPDGC